MGRSDTGHGGVKSTLFLLEAMMEETIYDKINSGRYKNTKPNALLYKGSPEEKQEVRKSYNQEQGRLDELFYRDCCEHNSVNPDNPKTHIVFNKAYEMGHAHGHYEVYNYFYDLTEFVGKLGVDLR